MKNARRSKKTGATIRKAKLLLSSVAVLMAGGVVGAQFGAVAGERLKAEQLRFLLAALVLMVGLRFAWQLIAPPADLYSIGAAVGGA